MKFVYTNYATEIMGDAELLGSSDAVINETLGNQKPGTVLYAEDGSIFKVKAFDGSWKDWAV